MGVLTAQMMSLRGLSDTASTFSPCPSCVLTKESCLRLDELKEYS